MADRNPTSEWPEDLAKLRAVAQSHIHGGSLTDGIKVYQLAIRAAEAMLPDGSVYLCILISELAHWQNEMREFDAAHANRKRVIELMTRQLGAEHPSLSEAYGALARSCTYRGDFTGALTNLDRAEALARSAQPPLLEFAGDLLLWRESVSRSMERHDDAYAAARAAVQAYEAAVGGGPLRYPGPYWRLLSHERKRKHWQGCEECLVRIRAIAASNPDEPPLGATFHKWLGEVRAAQGRFAEALASFEEGLACYRIDDPSPPPIVNELQNLVRGLRSGREHQLGSPDEQAG